MTTAPNQRTPIPAGTVLFHGGFHKTGTTALQSALASSRHGMADRGVLYPGERRSHHRAAMAVMGKRWGWGERGGHVPSAKYWRSLVAETQAHPDRVVISSEAFSLATDPALDRIVADLDGSRMMAVLTLRSMSALLPSSYQQYLKYGLSLTYEAWLESVFHAPPTCVASPNFWRRNDHAGLAERWAQRLGPDRVLVVVLDPRDRPGLFRTFEQLLELPDGLLVPDPAISASNRSMTAAEAEMLRLVNAGGARLWGWKDYEAAVRRGAAMRMVESRTPEHTEPHLVTPDWAMEASSAVASETAERIRSMGVRVVGDLGHLSVASPSRRPVSGPALLPASAAAEALLGAAMGLIRVRPDPEKAPTPARSAPNPKYIDPRKAIEELRTAEVARVLGHKIRVGIGRRLSRASHNR